jgi:nucleotidyltransferase substrate binding protein (TIGR01987 family)
MDKKKISTQALEKALDSLKRAILQPKNEFSRDSVIQRFEYTFELSWKLLTKILEADSGSLADNSVKAVLREAARLGNIQKLDLWFEFQKARNITSHTYNEVTAEEVYSRAILLPAEVDFLLKKISSK